jgi:hypothetical protein
MSSPKADAVERGIFRSDSAGRRWVRVNDGEHQYAWTGAAITGDPRVYGRVYVSTNGRGIAYGEPSRHSRHEHDEDCDRYDRDDRAGAETADHGFLRPTRNSH